MSTQYDTIQAPYDYMRQKSIARIEHENVQTTIAPFIHNARVLELACGSGFYTYDFLKWGARSVVGVDISATMIEEARRRRKISNNTAIASSTSTSIDFTLADCSKPMSYAGGPFDLVFGAWLLNYAPDRAGLVDMFRNIALNLKDGGHFVSVTVPPAQDPTAAVNAELHARPPPEGSGGLVYRVIRDVEDGIFFHCHADTEVGDVDFDCYYLRKDIYEAAAREGGMKGELRWGVTSVPERYLRGEGPGGASMEELESYQRVPNYGLLVVTK
ncbi:MAG: hypothetical protein Q9164_003401 [Protoblastenia rupestris]